MGGGGCLRYYFKPSPTTPATNTAGPTQNGSTLPPSLPPLAKHLLSRTISYPATSPRSYGRSQQPSVLSHSGTFHSAKQGGIGSRKLAPKTAVAGSNMLLLRQINERVVSEAGVCSLQGALK